jgi:amino acid transporter
MLNPHELIRSPQCRSPGTREEDSMSTVVAPRTGSGQEHEPAPTRAQQKAHALGLTSATGLVVGSIVGTGVFAMPAVLAGAGTSSLIVLAVIAVGATLLALLFGQLTKRVPNSDGGLYAYARHEFGDFAGYLVGWCSARPSPSWAAKSR